MKEVIYLQKTVTDRVGRTITYNYPPKRIVSLCPGITDTLFSLNLKEELVGRTRFCIYPKEEVKEIPAVAGTKDIKIDKIHDVKPDLIIVEKEENTEAIVTELQEHYPVYVAEVQSIEEAHRMIVDMGELTDRKEEAKQLSTAIRDRFSALPSMEGKRAAYIIWKKPYMAVGRDTYIQSVLHEIGLINPFIQKEGRYPVITEEDFAAAKLDYVLLATEPYPFKEKHFEEFKRMMPETKPLLIDGEMFWYGPRMLEAPLYLQQFVHTEKHEDNG